MLYATELLKIVILTVLINNVILRSRTQKISTKFFAMRWDIFSSLPDRKCMTNLGVTVVSSGISWIPLPHVNGTNFHSISSRQNGPKNYWNSDYVFKLERSKFLRRLDTKFSFPYSVLYRAPFILDESILYIGANIHSGYLSKVLLQRNIICKWIGLKPYPELSISLPFVGTFHIRHMKYVSIGENEMDKQYVLYTFDFEKYSWIRKMLPPLLGGPLSDAVLVSQPGGDHEQLFYGSGRTMTQDHAAVFSHKVYPIALLTTTWKGRDEITNNLYLPVGLASVTWSVVGDLYIALFRSDDSILFNVLVGYKKQAYFDLLSVHHFGFNKRVFYNTIIDICVVMGSLMYPAQVTFKIINKDLGHPFFLRNAQHPHIKFWELKTWYE
ncbi:MAG: hypothetical protein IRZ03_14895 [Acidobacterium ailaaui]|nr:hypothetical protein [Pseudacidobacterium ailaaui]